MSNIDKVHTCCKNCFFATYEKNTQIGCELNYIDIFKHQNIDIIEAYDDEKEFFLINKKQCIGYTQKEALARHGLQNASMSEIVSKYHDLNKLNYALIIDTKKISLKNLIDFLHNTSFNIKPHKIIIVRYPNITNKIPFYSLEKILSDNHIPWKIISLEDNDTSIDSFINNICMFENRYRFLLYMNNINATINDVVDYANNIVHQKLDQFTLIKNQNKTAMLFPATTYRYYRLMGDNLLTNETDHIMI